MNSVLSIAALVVSAIALVFTFLKDFIIPFFCKPKFDFEYKEKPPFRRENLRINRTENKGTFLRFLVKNIGKKPAINCRCQILKVKKDGKNYGDYQGFPLKWAGRPEYIINQASGERLNLAQGEIEFIDLAATRDDRKGCIVLQKYHDVDIGIKEEVTFGRYEILLIFSGDNFKPYKLLFEIEKDDSLDINGVKLKLLNYCQ